MRLSPNHLLARAFLVLTLTGRLFGTETIETSIAFEGARNVTGLALMSVHPAAWGVVIRQSFTGEMESISGFNGPGLAAGHLDDSGLLAELRNPEASALGRLMEDTDVRADLRTFSDSRVGLGLMPWNGRLGLVWEQRDDTEFGSMWFVPVARDRFITEFFGQYGKLESSEGEEKWYPLKLGSPGGPFAVAAGRVRFYPGSWVLGLTTSISGGSRLRPGWLVAVSGEWLGENIRFRTRSIYGSPYYRNSDGKWLDEQLGWTADFRRSSGEGFQLFVKYEFERSRLGQNLDSGELEIGWKFQEWGLKVSSDWNWVAFPDASLRESLLKKIEGRIKRDKKNTSLQIQGSWEPDSSWITGLQGGLWVSDPLLMEADIKLRKEYDEYLVDCSLNVDFKTQNHRIKVKILMGNLTKNWEFYEASSDDFQVEIRWIYRWGD